MMVKLFCGVVIWATQKNKDNNNKEGGWEGVRSSRGRQREKGDNPGTKSEGIWRPTAEQAVDKRVAGCTCVEGAVFHCSNNNRDHSPASEQRCVLSIRVASNRYCDEVTWKLMISFGTQRLFRTCLLARQVHPTTQKAKKQSVAT